MTVTASIEQEEQFVAFRLSGETYGIPITLVHEIIRSCEITQIPRTPEYVRGVVNLRGKIVPVIDLRRRLGLPEVEKTGATRIVVVEVNDSVIGMIVDSVSEVIRILNSQIEPPTELVADVEKDLISGVGKRENGLIILLDIPKTVRMEE